MRIPPRVSLLLLLLGLGLCLGILFRSYVLEYVVEPIAILLLYLWRIIRSVHQGVYWGIILFSVLIYGCYQLFFHRLQRPASVDDTPPSGSNATLENIRYWRTMILVTQDESEKANILKRELGKMLASTLACKQPGSSTVEMFNALKLHKIPLPENTYNFLFPEQSAAPRRSFPQTLQAIWQAPRRWLSKWTDREAADYHRSIEQVIAYMESSMEIENDPEPVESLKY